MSKSPNEDLAAEISALANIAHQFQQAAILDMPPVDLEKLSPPEPAARLIAGARGAIEVLLQQVKELKRIQDK